MKNQNQFVQAMKCCLTKEKFALLFISIFFLLTSCKQSGSQNSETVSDKVSNLISSSPCDKFIGKYSRQQTASSITTTSNIEFKKDQDFYKLFITANSTTNNPSLQMAVNVSNERFKATFPSDGIVCTCNEKGNIEINIDGKKVESMIDNNGNVIYGGLTFYKLNNENNLEKTEEATEATTDKNINEPIEIFTEKDVKTMETTNQKLVAEEFIGEWEQESAMEQVTNIKIKYLEAGKFQIIIKELNKPSQHSELDITEGIYNGYLNSDNKIKIVGFNYTIEKSTHSTESQKYKYISLFISRKPTKNNIAEGAYMEYYQKK
jgi:hypothetical protein